MSTPTLARRATAPPPALRPSINHFAYESMRAALTLDREAFDAAWGDAWALVGDRQRTRLDWLRAKQLVEIIRAVADAGIVGDYAEFGVWRGGALYLAALAFARAGRPGTHAWGFDSFQGLPDPDDRLDGPLSTTGQFGDVHLDEVRAFFDAHRLAERVTLVPGWFEDTIEQAASLHLSVLHVDADLHDSVRLVLDRCWPSLAVGGVLLIDDYRFPNCAGATIAVESFFARRPEEIRMAAGFTHSAWVQKLAD